MGIIHFEFHVLDHKRPHFVAESIDVKMSLDRASVPIYRLTLPRLHGTSHLECHASFDFVAEYSGNVLIEVGHDAHSKLRFDAPRTDQVVERVGESEADAARIRCH